MVDWVLLSALIRRIHLHNKYESTENKKNELMVVVVVVFVFVVVCKREWKRAIGNDSISVYICIKMLYVMSSSVFVRVNMLSRKRTL